MKVAFALILLSPDTRLWSCVPRGARGVEEGTSAQHARPRATHTPHTNGTPKNAHHPKCGTRTDSKYAHRAAPPRAPARPHLPEERRRERNHVPAARGARGSAVGRGREKTRPAPHALTLHPLTTTASTRYGEKGAPPPRCAECRGLCPKVDVRECFSRFSSNSTTRVSRVGAEGGCETQS